MREGASYPCPGDIVAEKYRIVRLLGEGGMGAVFSAEHVLLRQHVALKIRRASGNGVDRIGGGGDRGVARFLNEARAAARLENEHVARVMDVGVLPSGMAFIVMELLGGLDLAALLAERGPLPAAEAVGYVLQAIEGIADAHAHGIVHRDLKPANLFRVQSGRQKGVVKVLDFGVSKLTNPLGGAIDDVTTGPMLLGTPSYMSPEQIRAPKTVDARADIWALGVILYELIAGARPFEGQTLGELLTAVLEQTPQRFDARGIVVDPALEATIRRCLEVAPEFRFPDVVALAEALVVGREDGETVLAGVRSAHRGSERDAEPRSPQAGEAGVAGEPHAPIDGPSPANPMGRERTATLTSAGESPSRGPWEDSIVPRTRVPAFKVVGAFVAVAAVATTLAALVTAHREPPMEGVAALRSAAPAEARSESAVAAAPAPIAAPTAERVDPSPAPSASSVANTRGPAAQKIETRHRPRPLDAGASAAHASAAGDPSALDLLNRH